MWKRVVGGLACGVLLAGCTGNPTVGEVPPDPMAGAGGLPVTSGAPKPPGFTLVAGGDVLIHPALSEQARADGGFAPLFGGVKTVLDQADVAVCHLEVPIAAPGGAAEGYPRFVAPNELASGLAASGFDTCSTASNHTLDQGAGGVTSTLDALDAAGVTHTGSARTAAEAAKPLVRDVAGVKVGFVSFTFGLNTGTRTPPGSPWMVNTLDSADVVAAARAARAVGAEVVVASLHWGTEGQHEVTASQRRIAREVLADPAVDVIIGHHAHVVQPFEQVNGKWVAYGLGNQVARHEEPKGVTEEGAMARFHFAEGAGGWVVDRAEYIPTVVDLGPPIRLRDLTADAAAPRRAESLARTDGIVLSLGAGQAGLTRP
ncbi:lipoprotein [Actinokineospora spheciospongiae]|uniref:Lipoprotein n=2 Tax=Actinokineospora spheciospongiae TaxID=909613 RepID=W7ID15_9PSEU|nr:lipoprotein [Actinokineospora spheciospongiae]